MTGPEFRRIRLSLKLSQALLADRLGIRNAVLISNWENDKAAIPRAMAALMQAMAEGFVVNIEKRPPRKTYGIAMPEKSKAAG